MATGNPLPGIRTNSKNALAKLKDSELGSWSIHGDKFSSLAIYHQLAFVEQYPWSTKYALLQI